MEKHERVRCWIVCKPCGDPYYDGHPTGMVFTDEVKAKEYIERANGPLSEGDTGEHDYYLQKGYLKIKTSEQWNILAGRCIETPDGVFYLAYGADKYGNPYFRDFVKLDKIAYQVAALPQLVEALEQCEYILDDMEKGGAENPELAVVRRALAKAKGDLE